MKFITQESFWNLFPNARIGVLVLENVNEKKELSEKEAAEIKALLDDANNNAGKYLTSDVISENHVVSVWREAYGRFPTKKGARCSIEALLKRVLHGNPVSTIAPSIDITNSISLKYALPIGAEDIDRFEGNAYLGTVKGGEEFFPIGSDKEEPPLAGELAYYDDRGVICRCWNWRDGKRTCVTDDTTREFIAMECVEESRFDDLQNAIDELAELMTRYVDARVVSKAIVSADNREVELD